MKSLILGATVLPVMLLSACSSTFNVGDSSKLSCPQSVKGMPCVTVRAAYYAAQEYDPDEVIQIGLVDEKGGKNKRTSGGVAPFLPESVPNVAAIGEPKPLLEPAKVMRVWVNAYEDESGNLVYPSRVFFEVTPRKWDVGYSASQGLQSSRRITPLVVAQQDEAETESDVDTAQEAAEETAKTVPSARQNNRQQDNQAIPDSLPAGVIPPLQ